MSLRLSIFINFTREDYSTAQRLRNDLVQSNYVVTLASDLRNVHEIDQCSAMLFIIPKTTSGYESIKGFYSYASRQIPLIIPLAHDATVFINVRNYPYVDTELKDIQWISIYNYQEAIEKIRFQLYLHAQNILEQAIKESKEQATKLFESNFFFSRIVPCFAGIGAILGFVIPLFWLMANVPAHPDLFGDDLITVITTSFWGLIGIFTGPFVGAVIGGFTGMGTRFTIIEISAYTIRNQRYKQPGDFKESP